MSNYSDVRKRLDAQRAVSEAAVELAAAYAGAKGNSRQRDNEPEVVEKKLKMVGALAARDGDLSAAVEKALSTVGIRRSLPAWLVEGVEVKKAAPSILDAPIKKVMEV